MKTIAFLTAFLFVFNHTFSQELKITYTIKMESSDPETQFQIQMSEGSRLTVYTKDDKSRVEMAMGQLMKTTTILDLSKKQGLTLIEGVIGKQAATFEGEDFEQFNTPNTNVEIEYFNDTKIILGYECKKAIVYMNEEDTEMIFWYTNDLEISEVYLGEYTKYGLPGVALEYGVMQEDVSMKFVAKKVENTIKDSDSLFNLEVPSGYIEKSYREISNMSGR